MTMRLLERIAPPRFADPETDRVSRSAFVCALVFIALALVWMPVAAWLQGEGLRVLVFGWSAIAGLAGVALLARAGRGRTAAAILVGVLFASGVLGLWVEGGLSGDATATFIAVVVAAGLFFGNRVSWATAAVSVLLLGVTWVLEAQGLLPAPRPYAPERVFVSTALITALVLVLVQLNFDRIRASEQFLKTVTDETPHALYVYDLSEGRNAYANTTAWRNLGATSMHPQTRASFVAHLHPDDVAVMDAHARRLAQLEDDETIQVEYRIRHPDGGYRIIRDRARVFDRAADGRVRQVIGTAEDVTTEREAQRALESSRERIRRGERLEALGQLAGGIAHDFNNYLTVILGATEAAAHDPSASDSLRELVADAHAAAQRSAELTHQLLGFSRQRLTRPSSFELNALLEESDRLLRRVIPENIEIDVMTGAATSTIHADRSQIEQIVLNLAVNARDAMPEGGSLTISTTVATIDAARAARHEGVEPGEYVVLHVADTGVGVDEAIRAKIFEPLFTTKEAGAGTGFGLATVEAVVSRCGGFIEIETAVGTGTRFAIHLPKAEAERGGSAPAASPSAAAGSERILLVEDDPHVRGFTQRALESAGYRVVAAADGAEGLARFRASPGDFDLLLTDVMLPNVSGLDLASTAREIRPDLAVVFMSGYATSELADRGLRSKDHLLDKPFTIEELQRQVRAALETG